MLLPTLPGTTTIPLEKDDERISRISSSHVKELDELRAFKKRVYIHLFYVIIQPITVQSVPWHVNLNSVKLTDLHALISKEYPKFGNATLFFQFRLKDHTTEQPDTDKDLQRLLDRLVTNDEMTIKITVTTPAKPYSDWTLPAVRELFSLEKYGSFPAFSCGSIPPTAESLKQLENELKLRIMNTPIKIGLPEASRSLYTYSYLLSAVENFKQQFNVMPEERIDGPHGTGPVDYMIKSVTSLEKVGVTEVKNNNFEQGIAQCAIQLESVIDKYRKRKAEEIEEVNQGRPERAFGIVTDAEKFVFLKCLISDEGIIGLEVSQHVSIDYRIEGWQDTVKRILGNIVWLLGEALDMGLPSERDTKRMKTR